MLYHHCPSAVSEYVIRKAQENHEGLKQNNFNLLCENINTVKKITMFTDVHNCNLE